ncbi:ATP-dependent 6-phosphofructokinase 4, chloroplastic isoform X4 [Malania oleifera]|uniref:ATP-dependent 6-phosphofructokinase 4, chloroplastic isoform X4 n=1 Tax=Malania oleifera TaxID=397392 RepID=UPI0025ADCD02|nr:ATP-dependent 6-phosphofructokinase 4, chloroplastic isoform X4 [Malania oleifera]
MDFSVVSSTSFPFFPPGLPLKTHALIPSLNQPSSNFNPRIFLRNPLSHVIRAQNSLQATVGDFVLEDVPHLTHFLPDLPSYPNPLQRRSSYAIVKQYFVSPEDVVAQKIVVQKDSPRGAHFRRAGPREKVYFNPDEVRACIVTCGGLCPGINTVIREIVCGLNNMYGVDDILGIEVIDKSFGFDTAVEEAQRAINAAHVEVESVENGVGIVKLMGRYSGFIAMFATLASRDVDCCLIPESPFYLEGQGGIFEFVEQRLRENGHVVIVLAEGAGQEYVAQSMRAVGEKDASGNQLLLDVGPWISQRIKDHFTKQKMTINMKYIDPTYMIRAIPSNASDNIYCTLLAQSAVHGAMAGYTGFTVGPVNSKHAYIPISRVTETRTIKLTDRMWARLLASTNQPSFMNVNDEMEQRVDKQTTEVINNATIKST